MEGDEKWVREKEEKYYEVKQGNRKRKKEENKGRGERGG